MRFASRSINTWAIASTLSFSFDVARAWTPVRRQSTALVPTLSAAFSRRYAQQSLSRSTSQRLSMSTEAASSGDKADKFRVALCQFHVTPDKATNHQTAKEFIQKAADGGADLCVLPEVWNSPYATAAFPEYAEKLPNVGDESMADSASAQLLHDLAKANKMWIVGGSVPETVAGTSSAPSAATSDDNDNDEKSKIYNTCLVMDPTGKVVAKHRKVHLFDIDVPGGITFFESETLSPGESVSVFETPIGNIGVGICYDIRFAEYAMLLRQQHNCKIIVYPGAFNMTTGPAHWELLQRGRALDNQCYVITASPARSEPPADESTSKYPHYTAWGHSTVVSPWGDVLETTDESAGVVFADLDMSKVEEIRQSLPIYNQRRTDIYKLEQTK